MVEFKVTKFLTVVEAHLDSFKMKRFYMALFTIIFSQVIVIAFSLVALADSPSVGNAGVPIPIMSGGSCLDKSGDALEACFKAQRIDTIENKKYDKCDALIEEARSAQTDVTTACGTSGHNTRDCLATVKLCDIGMTSDTSEVSLTSVMTNLFQNSALGAGAMSNCPSMSFSDYKSAKKDSLEKISQAQKDITSAQADAIDKKAELEGKQNDAIDDLNKLKAENDAQKESDNADLRQKIFDNAKVITDLQKNIRTNESKIASAQRNLTTLQMALAGRLSSFTENIAKSICTGEIFKMGAEYDKQRSSQGSPSMGGAIRKKNDKMSELKVAFNACITRAYNDFNQSVMAEKNRIADKQAEINSLSQEIEADKAQIDQVNAQNKEEQDALKTKANNLDQKFLDMSNRAQAKIVQFAQQQTEYNKTAAMKQAQLAGEINQAQNEIKALGAQPKSGATGSLNDAMSKYDILQKKVGYLCGNLSCKRQNPSDLKGICNSLEDGAAKSRSSKYLKKIESGNGSSTRK